MNEHPKALCLKCGEGVLRAHTYAYHRIIADPKFGPQLEHYDWSDEYAIVCEGCGWTYGDPDRPQVSEDLGDVLRPVTCPTATNAPYGGKHSIVGCGSTNVVGPDHEGLYDCCDCGIFFDPERERSGLDPTRLTRGASAPTPQEPASPRTNADLGATRKELIRHLDQEHGYDVHGTKDTHGDDLYLSDPNTPITQLIDTHDDDHRQSSEDAPKFHLPHDHDGSMTTNLTGAHS